MPLLWRVLEHGSATVGFGECNAVCSRIIGGTLALMSTKLCLPHLVA